LYTFIIEYFFSASLFLLGDILEVGAQWAIAKKDVDAFERYMAQLKCYYLDYKYACLFLVLESWFTFFSFSANREDLPESAYKFQFLGLNLLRLLAQNKLADFHTVWKIDLQPVSIN
jgi:26S proteasome regulatory subunit N12